MTVCCYHVTNVFHNESLLYSCLDVKELLARSRSDLWSLSDSNGIRTHNHSVHKRTLNHSAKLVKWLSCIVSNYLYGALTVCYYHVMCAFQSESELCSCLNVKELFARNRRNIWSLSGSNGIWTHNRLVCKRALKHLKKLAKTCVRDTLHDNSTQSMHPTDNYSQHSSIFWSV